MNKNRPEISVIIPVYKVEAYINRCVTSVLNQTMGGIEIILVDDGSPDGCPAICDAYAGKYENIRVFHKKNGGLSSARNVGIKNAEGKYIFFLDSDDWLDDNGLERLYRVAEETGVDFVRFRSIRSGWPNKPEHTPTVVEQARELSGGYYSKERIEKEIYPRLLATSQLTLGPIVGAWGSLYRSSLLKDNQILFNEKIRYSEDIPFSTQVLLHTDSFWFVDEAGTYHYWYNKNSISKSAKKDRWISCRNIILDAQQQVKDRKEFEKQLNYLRWHCIFLALNERKYLPDLKAKTEYCRKILKDPMIGDAYIRNGDFDISRKQKMMMILVRLKMSGVIARL